MKKKSTTTIFRALSVLTLVAVSLAQAALPVNYASAAQITVRSLQLQAGASGDGGSMPGGTVNHLFTFTLPTSTAIGSLLFQYCTTAADVGASTCIAPTGIDVSTATLGASTGVTGLTKQAGAPANSFYLTRAPGGTTTPAANTVVTVLMNGVENPTDPNKTFFVRINSFLSMDASGTAIDRGTVAASTANQLQLSGVMPESLVFCTGETVGVNATTSIPDCSTAIDSSIEFNQLFSSTDTATATSQMAASTNAGSGYVITVNGPTLTSGSNTIAPMATPGASARATPQFGMNLRANTNAVATNFPGTSADPAPLANASNFRGEALTGYNTVDTFKFNSSDPVAASTNGGAGGTDAQIFTASYIANVPGSQPAGTYSTTLTYICTPTY